VCDHSPLPAKLCIGLTALIDISRTNARFLLACCVLATSLTTANPFSRSHAAEEVQLLSIRGDLIDVLETVNEDTEPTEIIAAYYSELNSAEQKEAVQLRQNLLKLIPDYEIAFAAADTAEVNSVLSEVAHRWAVLRSFHAKYFTDRARATLYSAYVEQYLLLN